MGAPIPTRRGAYGTEPKWGGKICPRSHFSSYTCSVRAAVTGASGFAGSALVSALREAGWQVHALTSNPSALGTLRDQGVDVFEGSIADPNQVAAAADDCDVLFHAAGVTHRRAPARVLRWVHVAGTENVLNAARHVGVERVVHLSCWSVSLSDEDRMHWDENRRLPHEPLGAHARTTATAEEIALAASDDACEVVALRPAWLWGAGDIGGLAALWHESQRGGFQLFGGGHNIIPTTHIDNLTRAALLAADAPEAAGHAYYITDGEFLEAREWCGQLAEAVGAGAPRTGGSLLAGRVAARFRQLRGDARGLWPQEVIERGRSALFDISQATRDLDYSPGHDLSQAMAATANWVQDQGGLASVASRARPVPTGAQVDAQVQAAGGD